jgi:hypothetical protein
MQYRGTHFDREMSHSGKTSPMKFKRITLEDTPGSLLEALQKYYEKKQSIRGITSIPNIDDTTDFIVTYIPEKPVNITYGSTPKDKLNTITPCQYNDRDYTAILSITPEHGSLRTAI